MQYDHMPMPVSLDQALLTLVVLLCVVLVAWYVAGNEVMRRRAHRLALWSKRVLDPSGGRQSIRWLSTQSFRLEVEEPRPPLAGGTITGLTESWDVPMLWLWNRAHGRQDMVLVQLTLRRQPLFGLELYRPGSLLAGDSRHLARREGWPEEPLDEFTLASRAGPARELASRLVATMQADRRRLVRLAVRRQAPNLTLAINVPERQRPDPASFNLLLRVMAERAQEYATPSS